MNGIKHKQLQKESKLYNWDFKAAITYLINKEMLTMIPHFKDEKESKYFLTWFGLDEYEKNKLINKIRNNLPLITSITAVLLSAIISYNSWGNKNVK